MDKNGYFWIDGTNPYENDILHNLKITEVLLDQIKELFDRMGSVGAADPEFCEQMSSNIDNELYYVRGAICMKEEEQTHDISGIVD